MRPLDLPCSRCGAAPGEPCRSVGRLRRAGDALGSYHAARRRAAAQENEDEAIRRWERWEIRRGLV